MLGSSNPSLSDTRSSPLWRTAESRRRRQTGLRDRSMLGSCHTWETFPRNFVNTRPCRPEGSYFWSGDESKLRLQEPFFPISTTVLLYLFTFTYVQDCVSLQFFLYRKTVERDYYGTSVILNPVAYIIIITYQLPIGNMLFQQPKHIVRLPNIPWRGRQPATASFPLYFSAVVLLRGLGWSKETTFMPLQNSFVEMTIVPSLLILSSGTAPVSSLVLPLSGVFI